MSRENSEYNQQLHPCPNAPLVVPWKAKQMELSKRNLMAESFPSANLAFSKLTTSVKGLRRLSSKRNLWWVDDSLISCIENYLIIIGRECDRVLRKLVPQSRDSEFKSCPD